MSNYETAARPQPHATGTASADHFAVVGAGAMGVQIACLGALSGSTVSLTSRSSERLEQARNTVTALIARKVEKGTLSATDGDEVCQAIAYTETISDCVAGASVIIESVAEDRDVKREVLREISQHSPDTAIIGSNSSTLGSSVFADVISNPERLLNIHFYNPPLLMALVEVVCGPHTSDAAVDRATRFVERLGKTPVHVNKEEFGFVANRMLFAAIAEALRLVQGGHVSIEDCDVAVKNALGWPLGPFALSDLIGLDVVEAILDEGVRQTGDQSWEPTTMLRELVATGDLGKKSGRGFTSG